MSLLSGFDNITGWSILQKNSAAIEKGYASTTSQAAQIAAFEKIAPTLKTPAELLANYQALDFVTTAYGLGGEAYQTAILKKLMTQDPTKSSSLAQQLSDNNYRKFADALSSWSPPPFSDPANIAAAVAGFKQAQFNSSLGQDNQALEEAEYFKQNIGSAKTVYQVMSDKALLDVAVTALGIPFSSFAALDFTQQVQILKPRLDLKDFTTTAGIEKFINQYLAINEVNQSNSGAGTSSTSTSSTSNPLLVLFNDGSSAAGSSSGLSVTSGMLNLVL
jgi:hypothetical protein